MVYPVTMTLYANGRASGSIEFELREVSNSMVYIPPSGNYPFQNAAACFQLQFANVIADTEEQLVMGLVRLYDCNSYPMTEMVPFIFYNGDQWPQAPIGMVHFPQMHEIGGNWKDLRFSLLFEMPTSKLVKLQEKFE